MLLVGQQRVSGTATLELILGHVCELRVSPSPQLFLFGPVRETAGHPDGPRRRRKSDVLVRGAAVHGLLGLHCQGRRVPAGGR